jgi:hypothetical protein
MGEYGQQEEQGLWGYEPAWERGSYYSLYGRGYGSQGGWTMMRNPPVMGPNI